jgi:heptosyltransferase II
VSESILINLPTNIGDAVLGLPVVDRMRSCYPQGLISVIASPRTKDFLLKHSCIDRVIVFNKKWKFRHKVRFALALRGRFNIVVDLKNSFLPAVIGSKKRTSFFRFFKKEMHIKDRYLKLVDNFSFSSQQSRGSIVLNNEEEDKCCGLGLSRSVFMSCSSLFRGKRYKPVYIKQVIQSIRSIYPVVILGQAQDRDFYGQVLSEPGVIDLVGRTSIAEVFYLLENYAALVVSVDSSILHIASYLNLSVVSLFGPTSPGTYGPYSDKRIVLTKEGFNCSECLGNRCKKDFECMNINPKKVISAVNQII